MLVLNHNINTLFVMLGTACNLNCKYCMQHALIEYPSPKREIKKEIIDFIVKNAGNQPHKLDVRFYGGEPLLYFDDIKQIVDELKERKANVRYSIISNGKLLTDEIVQFCNENQFEFAVSWDGANVGETRFYDVLKEHKNELLKIENLWIDGVITSKNYPLDFLKANAPFQEEYSKIHNRYYGVFFDQIMDCDASSPDLTDVDYAEVERQTGEIIRLALQSPNTPLGQMCFAMLYNHVFIMKTVEDCVAHGELCHCSNAVRTLNMDLNGNLYQCHNNWNRIGNIFDDDVDKYLRNASDNESISKINYASTCKDCPASPVCLTGCPLICQEAREKTGFCELKRASFVPFIKAARSMQLSGVVKGE